MSVNERGGFRPPKLDKLVWQCPECKGFSSTKVDVCKNCGAKKPEKK